MIELTHQNISQINNSDNNKCISWFGGRAVLSFMLGISLSHSKCFPNRYIGSNLIHTTKVNLEFVCKPGQENSAWRLYKLQDRQYQESVSFFHIRRRGRFCILIHVLEISGITLTVSESNSQW
ncbi:Hypothetical_protein [Hexamita inflata]|uniref:Hypothetical_protein n=1 Tax=Hexamita inflata TaxID=28002 RepID=A0ABP1HC26_9EUKA